MKTKIILTFFLFTISLFGQIEIENDVLFIKTSERVNQNLHCEILLSEPISWCIYFVELKEQIQSIKTDNFNYYFKTMEVSKDSDGFWMSAIVSLDNNTRKKILKDILNTKYVIITTDRNVYSFNFNKYKRELENNAFYKKIMQ